MERKVTFAPIRVDGLKLGWYEFGVEGPFIVRVKEYFLHDLRSVDGPPSRRLRGVGRSGDCDRLRDPLRV
jgi:hypothetical protein